MQRQNAPTPRAAAAERILLDVIQIDAEIRAAERDGRLPAAMAPAMRRLMYGLATHELRQLQRAGEPPE